MRLLPDGRHETRPIAETGRPQPATGCSATGPKAFETQPPERRSVSDRQDLPAREKKLDSTGG
ncbi:MAG TPA: hypothetical protein EYH03_00360 [Chromatiales bacterium]|nr:hypothetical protein [Chromatiales bacterium]